jgi:hypothetical protein
MHKQIMAAATHSDMQSGTAGHPLAQKSDSSYGLVYWCVWQEIESPAAIALSTGTVLKQVRA